MFYLTQQRRGSFKWRQSGCKVGWETSKYSLHTLGHAWPASTGTPALLLVFAPPARWIHTFAALAAKANWSNVKKTCAYSRHSVNINLLEDAIGMLRESNKGQVLEMQSAPWERDVGETEPRLEWALCPEGCGGSLHSPCPHYGRQGARPRINGDGLDTNASRIS